MHLSPMQALAKRSMYYKLLRHHVILRFDDRPRFACPLSGLNGRPLSTALKPCGALMHVYERKRYVRPGPPGVM